MGVCGWNPMGVGGPSSGPCISMASVGAAGVGGATNVLSSVLLLMLLASALLVAVVLGSKGGGTSAAATGAGVEVSMGAAGG